MSLQEQIRNIIFYYVKTQYNNYLKKKKIKFIDDNKIYEIIKKMYIDKKKDLQQFIKSCLKEMMKDSYPGVLVENIIYDIFSDEEIAINRVALEIQKYQNFINDNSCCEEYEITFPIDPDYGIGLKIDFLENDVIVKNYKRKNNIKLPAEESGKISIGDSLIRINNKDIIKLSTDEKVKIVKNAIKNDIITLKFRTFVNKLSIDFKV